MRKNRNTKQKNICIVIPCFNEINGLSLIEYNYFIEENPTTLLCFVNDGSTDGTKELLETIKNKFKEQVIVVSSDKNEGKAEAVRKGILHCNKINEHQYIAYLDADLSTSLEECKMLTTYLNDQINFVFGSRIMKIGSTIVRDRYRFFIGRVIATIISNILKLKVYDTQCGCKIFTKEISKHIFEKPFLSKWLFDVEIFNRIINFYGRENVLNKMFEVPLLKWIDKGDSKVKPSYFIRLWFDLYRINKLCRLKERNLNS